MAINDPLGDMLTRIRNAQMRRRPKVVTPASNIRGRVLDVLALKYYNGEPAIRESKRVSTPGRRVYSPVRDLPTVANGLGVAILSTPKGVMSDSSAREQNVGGEILCNIF